MFAWVHRLRLTFCSCFLIALLSAGALNAANDFIGQFSKVSTVASAVPSNGDQNPYGVAVVQRSTGNLIKGRVLVSNFNNNGTSGGQQGRGTTIVQIAPNGKVDLFAQINASKLLGPRPGGIGLTTALVVLQSGWVIVGSLPTSDGTAATAQAGCLIVLNDRGKPVKTLSGNLINGPWDMTALDLGRLAVLFVTNVLNGTVAQSPSVVDQGTVVRILLSTPYDDGNENEDNAPRELTRMVIASGFGERTDPSALVIGPTGVGLGLDGTLYVADTLANRIAAIPNALFRVTSADTGSTVSLGGSINGPLGLAIAPNGHILVVNGLDGNIVETSPSGVQVDTKTISAAGGGALFGLAIVPGGNGIYFVDDSENQLNRFHDH
jgi:hypothetical protein